MARAPKKLPNGARRTTKEELSALLEHVTRSAAARPGVYRMLSEEGGVLYVGKSKRVKDRLLSYFRAGRREKGARILRETRAIDWEYTPSEFAALRRELQLIKRYRPRFNVMGKRDALHYAFLRVTEGTAPKLVLSRSGERADGHYFGPFIGPGLVADVARELSDSLGLRDCPDSVVMHYRKPGEKTPVGLRAPDCVRHETGKCLGPCVGWCTEAEYDARVGLARDFLSGKSDAPIKHLRKEMLASKERLEYERAALFRDRLLRVSQLKDQFAKIRFAVESMSFVYPAQGFGGDDRVYLIRRGTVRAEMKAPSSTAERFELQRLVDAVFKPSETARNAAHEMEEILLLTAWFRNHPGELSKTWVPVIT